MSTWWAQSRHLLYSNMHSVALVALLSSWSLMMAAQAFVTSTSSFSKSMSIESLGSSYSWQSSQRSPRLVAVRRRAALLNSGVYPRLHALRCGDQDTGFGGGGDGVMQTQGVRSDSQRRTRSKTVVMLAHPSKRSEGGGVQEGDSPSSAGRKDSAENKKDGDNLHTSLKNVHDAASTSHSKSKEPASKDSSASAISNGHGVVGRIPLHIPGITGIIGWDGSWNVVSGAGDTTATGHATNGTKPRLNGSETAEKQRRRLTRADAVHVPLKSSGVDDASKRTRSLRKKRLRVTRTPPAGEGGERAKVGRRPLVVTGDMELGDIASLVEEVLERVGENERELRRLRKEVAVPKPRSSVRARTFVIDSRAKMLGAAFAGSVAGMILGWSVLPNLWLLGAFAGAITFAAVSRTKGTLGGLCSTAGIQVALVYKDVRDWWEQTVFLYKTGKLGYTYWRVFEKYDRSWGITEKYTDTMRRLSTEAVELDRQYKIRAKASRARRSMTTFTKRVGSSTIKEVTQFAGAASDWSTTQLQQWGLIGKDGADNLKKEGLRLGRFIPYKNRTGSGKSGSGSGVDGKRPLGISLDLSAFFGGNSHSLYSAPAAGKARKPGYRGDPVIPARIRHLLMTPKQIRDERLRKYRVGFMGMRVPRSFDKDD